MELKSRIFEHLMVGIKGRQPRKTAVSRVFSAYLLDCLVFVLVLGRSRNRNLPLTHGCIYFIVLNFMYFRIVLKMVFGEIQKLNYCTNPQLSLNKVKFKMRFNLVNLKLNHVYPFIIITKLKRRAPSESHFWKELKKYEIFKIGIVFEG